MERRAQLSSRPPGLSAHASRGAAGPPPANPYPTLAGPGAGAPDATPGAEGRVRTAASVASAGRGVVPGTAFRTTPLTPRHWQTPRGIGATPTPRGTALSPSPAIPMSQWVGQERSPAPPRRERLVDLTTPRTGSLFTPGAGAPPSDGRAPDPGRRPGSATPGPRGAGGPAVPRHAGPGVVPMSRDALKEAKRELAPRCKAAIKEAQGRGDVSLSRDEFREACRQATHALVERCDRAGRPVSQVSEGEVRQAVRETLSAGRRRGPSPTVSA